MSNTLSIASMFLSDFMMYPTLPVHCRLFYVLLKRRTELEPSYQILLLNMTLFNILYATSYILIQEPAAYGAVPQFYADAAQILGRIELIKDSCVFFPFHHPKIRNTATVLALGQAFSLMIALNRLTAFAFPMQQSTIWTPFRARIMCCAVWIAVLIGSAPVVFGDSTGYRFTTNFFGLNSVAYFFLGLFDAYYPLGGLVWLGICEYAKIVVYVVILLLLRRYKQMRSELSTSFATISKGVCRMTAAAAASSLGGWSIFLFFAAYYVYQWITGTKLVNFTNYAVALRLTTSFNNALPPWVMLLMFRNIRHMFLGQAIVKKFKLFSTAASSVGTRAS